MTEPTTQAGRGLLTQSLRADSPALREWIVMIEAEATAAAEQRLRTELAEKVRTLDYRMVEWWHQESYSLVQVVNWHAVLTILDAATEPTGLCGDPDPKHPGRSCTIATGHGGDLHANDHYEWES